MLRPFELEQTEILLIFIFLSRAISIQHPVTTIKKEREKDLGSSSCKRGGKTGSSSASALCYNIEAEAAAAFFRRRKREAEEEGFNAHCWCDGALALA